MNTAGATVEVCQGGCLCGAVRYQIRGAIQASSVCHCHSCRKASTAPAVAWVGVRSADFRFLSVAPATFRSSADVTRSFCGRCGSPLTYQRDGEASTLDVTTALLDDPEASAPTHETWLEDRLQWAMVNPLLGHFPRGTHLVTHLVTHLATRDAIA